MKKTTLLILFFAIMCFFGKANAQNNYYVVHGADVNVTHSTHYPVSVSIVGENSASQIINNIASAPRCAAYFDKSGTIFEVASGDKVTPNITINGDWMHGYVFVDWNNNGQFDVVLEGSGPYTKGSGNELMCWSNYSKTGNGDQGWNSDGTYLTNTNVLTPGTFQVPEGLTEGATYRMRYMVAWNSVDATGGYGNFISDGGSIIDVTLKIASPVEVTVNYPINDYEEPRVGTTPDADTWGTLTDGLHATWGSRDKHYSLHEVPTDVQKDIATVYAWKGERANIQAVLFSKSDQGTMTVRMTEWQKDGAATGITDAGDARFVNYVITDDYNACGNHPTSLPTWLVADVIDQDKPHAVPAMETRPVWCTLEIPRDIDAGTYTTALEIVDANGDVVKTLALNVVVDSHSLPTVEEQKFHLDFWQQPYAVSRYYQVERWSNEHFEALRPYLQALGRAGQRTVSAIMFYEPWGEQTHDKFDPMIQTTKKSNGTWEYDYTVFDKYVELCNEYGINKQINCFSMVPWDMSFRYYDEASGSYKYITTTTNSTAYRELWTNFLTAFKEHLVAKGWFEKTNIAMDERSESDMLNAYNIANSLGFKMALAGNYHASLSNKLQDFCVALGQNKYFTADQLASRKANNQITTIYTSCADAEPNIYTNSYPAEATFLPLYAAANNLDGYLHWAWINWDEHPLTDSRFRKFGSGDTYCYYPGNRSSVRFERMIEGIHQYEKIQILKEEYAANNPERLETLNALLKRFESHAVAGEECAAKVNDIEAFLNGLDVEIPEAQDVVTGYYHIVNKATSRTEHLFNNALLNGNSYKFTLQSNSMVNTNNGIWHVTVKDNNKLEIRNGDGNPMVAGANWGAGIAGTFTELTVGETYDVDAYRYYYFNEAINCTNGGANFKLNGTDFITTWADGPSNADDQLWRFEPVALDDMNIYNVVIDSESNSDVYVTYTNGATSEYAFDGGFFISANTIEKSALKVSAVGNIVKSSEISIADGVITISNVKLMETPQKQDLFNTSNGDGVIPPYRIPGITTTSTGRLIATAARLVCGTDPGYGQVDVVCRKSDNNGDTWSEIEEVAVGTGITSATQNYFDTAFGDPAVVADRTSEEVIIIAVAGCTVYTNGNTTRQNPNLVALIRSTDNGDTWQEPINITEQIYSLFDSGNPIQAAFIGGGKIFQSRVVKKDKYYRLYAAMCARPNGNRVIYSDDFGATWHALGGASALPAPGGDEPKCEEMPDGRVILSSRVGGGRIYNIFNYTNTLEATGEWETSVKSTFPGSGLTPGGNSTNGEILVVPVVRNSDNKEMYLALQSLPTGSGRTNVGIYYKELTEFTDMNSVNNFAIDWNGFFQVSNTASAYSSMDLQADGRVGFIYEETLTSFGRRDNPISTSFPTGAGQHNFDGFDNIYVAYELEYITNGAYSLKKDADRRAFLQDYFNAKANDTDLSDEQRTEIESALQSMSEEPTTEQVDYVNSLFSAVEPADPWDGKIVTLTNVQQNNSEYALYIDSNNTLSISSQSAESLGKSAEFTCTKEESGKYSLYNEATKLYMIWRAGNNYGYNNNQGTLSSYNAAYCDWSINDASGTRENTYYIVSKRNDGTTDGSIIIMASGAFDSYSNAVGYSSNYSNLFRIDIVGTTVGIDNIITDQASPFDGNIYDMTGRQVERAVKGLYIINGKKVYIK